MHFLSVAARKAAVMMMLLLLKGEGTFVRSEEAEAAVVKMHSSSEEGAAGMLLGPSSSSAVSAVESQQQFLRERIISIEEESVSLEDADKQLSDIDTGDTGDNPFFSSIVEKAREHIAKAFAEIPKVVSYIESSALALEANSKEEGKKNEDKNSDDGGKRFDRGGEEAFVQAHHRRMTAVDADETHTSSSRRSSSSGGNNSNQRAGGSHSRSRSSFKDYINKHHTKHSHHVKLQEALANGDHAHVDRLLDSLKTKIDRHSGHSGRKLQTTASKTDQCKQLVKCVNGMSLYDYVVSLLQS
jgi:hypothetical protein